MIVNYDPKSFIVQVTGNWSEFGSNGFEKLKTWTNSGITYIFSEMSTYNLSFFQNLNGSDVSKLQNFDTCLPDFGGFLKFRFLRAAPLDFVRNESFQIWFHDLIQYWFINPFGQEGIKWKDWSQIIKFKLKEWESYPPPSAHLCVIQTWSYKEQLWKG